MKKLILVVIALIFAGTNVNAQKLDKFGADMAKKSVMGKEVRVPYTDMITYYGYVKPGAAPDETKDGKKYFYLYVWIPAAAPEIGIRMISPVPEKMAEPDKGDIVSPDYTANKTDTKNYYDTWISLESADGISSSADIAAKVKDILAHPEQAREISLYARAMVEEKYDWDNIAREMRTRVFAKVIQKS